jgi:phospholipid transport system substrate-binding protein
VAATSEAAGTKELTVKKILVPLILSLCGLITSPAFAQEPHEQVEQALAELAAALEGRKEEFRNDPAALYEMINGILLPRFNRTYSAQLVLGKNWKAADDEQRERFIDGFYNSLLRKYAEGVLEFDQERVQLLPFRGDLSKKRTIVKTNVFLDDGVKVTVNYGFAHRGDGWKMFDVTIEGISFVRNYRAEVDSEIRLTSLDAVIDRLESEARAATNGAAGTNASE